MKNRTCPLDENGGPTCDYYYQPISTKQADNDHWIAQYCHNCNHLAFLDKDKIREDAQSSAAAEPTIPESVPTSNS